MADPAHVDLKEFGLTLLTRDQGIPVRRRLAELVAAQGSVAIDLDGIQTMTPSFADEVFGRLLLDLGEAEFRKHVSLACADKGMKRLVNAVLANRSKQLKP